VASDPNVAGREVVLQHGLLLVVESPAALTMDMPAVGDAAPGIALPDGTGTIPTYPQRGRWTIVYATGR
jgi:hypothetical protein